MLMTPANKTCINELLALFFTLNKLELMTQGIKNYKKYQILQQSHKKLYRMVLIESRISEKVCSRKNYYLECTEPSECNKHIALQNTPYN